MDIKRTITQLTDELGEERVLTRTAIGADYCHDEYPGGSYAPDAVIEARTTEEVSRVLKVCCENGVFVTVRGAGTGQAGGSVAINGGIVRLLSVPMLILRPAHTLVISATSALSSAMIGDAPHASTIFAQSLTVT